MALSLYRYDNDQQCQYLVLLYFVVSASDVWIRSRSWYGRNMEKLKEEAKRSCVFEQAYAMAKE